MEERRSEPSWRDRPGTEQPTLEGLHGYFEESHSGPLPHPALLAEYERYIPGSAERIISMAERNQAAQIEAALTPVRAESWALRFATVAYSLTPIVVYLVAAALLVLGHDAAGIIVAIAATVTVGPQLISAIRRTSPKGRRKRS